MLMDLRFALRSLRRSSGFAIFSVLTLALGIGANTAIFSVVRGVILRPLAYPDSGRLVSLTTAWKNSGSKYVHLSGPDFLDYQSQSLAFASMAAYDEGIETVVANGNSAFTGIAAVSEDFLRTLEIQPVAGRAFSSSDFQGKPRVALVSAGFWQRHFGDVPFLPGRTLKTSGVQVEIIGLLPPAFHFPESSQAEVWLPLFEVLRSTNRGAHNYQVVARLKPGVSLEQAQAQLTAIASRLEKQYPGTNKGTTAYLTSLANFTVRRVKTSLWLLLAAVALVLLIACANVANLLLTRGSGRLRELAIRAAIGANRARIIRQLFVETLLLAAAGCVCGVFLAQAVLPALLAFAPNFVPRLNNVHLDAVTLLFCIVTALAASVLFGLAPAVQVSRADPNRDLRSGGARGALGGTTGRLHQAFVTAEVALCIVLLVSAGLLLRSFSAMTAVDLGFRPEKLLIANISVPTDTPQHANDIVYKSLLAKLSSQAQIQSAALIGTLPGSADGHSDGDYIITGQTLNDMTVNAPQAGFSIVSGSFFKTVGIPLLAGRAFTERDGPNAPLVAIINLRLARRSFPNVNPIGQEILCGLDLVSMKWMTIVGVVSDARLDGPTQLPISEIYLPYTQHPREELNLLVKTGANPLAFAQPLRSALKLLDSEASVKLTTMENQLAESVATPRFSSTLVSVFAGLAVLLAAIGIYGVIAYSVTQRTAEIGLRVALGANRPNILGMVLREALKLTGAGLLIGALGAIAVARLLESQLFEVSPADPAIYTGVLVLLTSVALAASYLPAWRASRIEPLEALRHD